MLGVGIASLLFCLATGLPEGSCKHIRDDRHHHSAESRWERHQGELLIPSQILQVTFQQFPAPTCIHSSLPFAPASWGARRQRWRRPRWGVRLHHYAQPYREKGSSTLTDSCSILKHVMQVHLKFHRMCVSDAVGRACNAWRRWRSW